MTPEELLKPRVKCIGTDCNHFPNSLFAVGEVLIIYDNGKDAPLIVSNSGEKYGLTYNIGDFPHLFRKLEWWEERDVKDMPEYVMYKFTKDSKMQFFKCPQHFTDSQGLSNKLGFFVSEYGFCSYSKSFPATEFQYNEYLNQKQ